MCNAYNHSPGCMCGWGGEGHLGHSYGGGGSRPSSGTIYRSYDSERSTRWHNQSMSELATELGHSLLFPVNCRYCGRLIYLFADPNGGFVIFNDVGKSWPKHQCRNMPPRPDVFYFSPKRYFPHYEMPVPVEIPYCDYKSGQRLSGAVVSVEVIQKPHVDHEVYESDLYRGHCRFKVTTEQEISVGDYIAGTVTSIRCIGECLVEIEPLVPPVGRLSA